MYMFEKINFYADEQPEFVEFNEKQVPYTIALNIGKIELQEMFGDCNYDIARELILSNEDVFSHKNGYSVADDYTGNLYLGWIVVRGNDQTRKIEWDIRHY